jgi:hypothetical protein
MSPSPDFAVLTVVLGAERISVAMDDARHVEHRHHGEYRDGGDYDDERRQSRP